jgi:hypothetical protein
MELICALTDFCLQPPALGYLCIEQGVLGISLTDKLLQMCHMAPETFHNGIAGALQFLLEPRRRMLHLLLFLQRALLPFGDITHGKHKQRSGYYHQA